MKNIVLVTMDSLRADHCGFMGYDKETTPVMDQLGEEGTVYKNAISPGPSTPESMPIILSGAPLQPSRDDHETKLEARRSQIGTHLASTLTLPERLSELGYETAGFSPNPYTSRYFGYDELFDYYEDFMTESRKRLYSRLFDGVPFGSGFPVRVFLNWIQQEEVFKPWEAYVDRILDWIEDTSQPFFIWILLMDTHDPYLPPAPYRSQSKFQMYKSNIELWYQGHNPPIAQETVESLITAYDDTIRYADEFVGRVNEATPDKTAIVVHGDHGEAFGEHGTFGHQPVLYEENIHVPLLVSEEVEDDVQRPISLEKLPEVVLSLVKENHMIDSCEKEYAVSRSLVSNRTAIRGRDWKFIRGPSEEKLLEIEEGNEVPLENAALVELGETLTEIDQQTLQERALLRDALDNHETGTAD